MSTPSDLVIYWWAIEVLNVRIKLNQTDFVNICTG
jgi:hypothetical protein